MMYFLRARWLAVTVVACVLTLGVIAVAVLTLTSAGCGVARSIGIKSTAGRCQPTAAVRATPSGGFLPLPSPINTLPQPEPSAAPNPPPNPPPESGPYPPPASGAPPYQPPESGSAPPFYGPGSGGPDFGSSLACRLPVYAGPPGSGGFIVFPGNTFVADPRSSVSVPSPSPGSPSPSPTYGGPGGYGLSYDRAYSRWLPVSRSWVTPDGSRYAYPSTGSIGVVSVATGVETELGTGHSWQLVGVVAEGVYGEYSGAPGLWYLPFSGTPKQVTGSGYWQAVTAGAAYGTETSAVPQGAANIIIRLDLASGTTAAWFTRPSMQSYVGGFDGNGNPVIYGSAPYGQETWIVSTNSATIIAFYNGGYGSYTLSGPPVADSHGLWFSGYAQQYGSGMILYVPGTGSYFVSTISGQLAGGCS